MEGLLQDLQASASRDAPGTMKGARIALAGLLMTLLGLFVAVPAEAASKVTFCSQSSGVQTYYSGAWHTLKKGDCRKITRSTPYRVNAKWRLHTINNQSPCLKANVAYKLGTKYPATWNWVVAKKGC